HLGAISSGLPSEGRSGRTRPSSLAIMKDCASRRESRQFRSCPRRTRATAFSIILMARPVQSVFLERQGRCRQPIQGARIRTPRGPLELTPRCKNICHSIRFPIGGSLQTVTAIQEFLGSPHSRSLTRTILRFERTTESRRSIRSREHTCTTKLHTHLRTG